LFNVREIASRPLEIQNDLGPVPNSYGEFSIQLLPNNRTFKWNRFLAEENRMRRVKPFRIDVIGSQCKGCTRWKKSHEETEK
jgi:hypothetical protein